MPNTTKAKKEEIIDKVQKKLWVIMRGTATSLKSDVLKLIEQALKEQRAETIKEIQEDLIENAKDTVWFGDGETMYDRLENMLNQ